MSAAHQMPQAQAERLVAAMVTGSRMANTEPSETDTHPRSDVLINWLGITDPADWKTTETSVIAQHMAKLLLHPLPAAPAPAAGNPRLHIKTRHLSPDAAPRCTHTRSHHMGTNAELAGAVRYYRDLHVDQLWDEAVPCEGVKDDDSVEGGATPRLAYRSCRAGVLAEAMGNP